jgi:hypothetical protein
MTKTTTKKQPSAQVEPAQKASALKVANEAKRAQLRRKLEAISEIPWLEKTIGRDGRSRPATTKGKSRAPSQKPAASPAGR